MTSFRAFGWVLTLTACAPQLDLRNGPDVPLDRRWVVECTTPEGARALVLTAARTETRCQSEDFDLPGPSDCASLREHFGECDVRTGPYATDGAMLAYVPSAEVTVDADGQVSGGVGPGLWLNQCVRGENEFGRIDVNVAIARAGEHAIVDIGHEWADAEGHFRATWCAAE
ncbi:MAG: hypothetical protein EP330_16340 [Deltaproteobacteria bacterium]|nr:MAG: hypothetical protein EP330_16340 [Deltaproteobacteria bacterium]